MNGMLIPESCQHYSKYPPSISLVCPWASNTPLVGQIPRDGVFDIRQPAARTCDICEYERASVDVGSTRNKEWESSGGGCGMRKETNIRGCTRYVVATYRCSAVTLTSGMIKVERYHARQREYGIERYVVPSTCSSSFRMGADRLASVLERLEDRTPNAIAQPIKLVAMECSTYHRRLCIRVRVREGVGGWVDT